MKLNNKKAEIGPTLTLVVATFIIVFILVVFVLFVSFIKAGISKESTKKSLEISAKESCLISLMAYLQTPVNVEINGNQENIKIADLIRLAVVNKSYEAIVNKETAVIFNNIYPYSYGLGVVNTGISAGSTVASQETAIKFYLPSSEKPVEIMFGITNKK